MDDRIGPGNRDLVGRFSADVERVAGRAVDVQHDGGVSGQTIEYAARHFDRARSWELIPAAVRDWSVDVAGDEINDPHTRVPQFYWVCVVRRSVGPSSAMSAPANFRLWVFGKAGLAVAKGSTSQLIDSPGATRWKFEGRALRIADSTVLSDHLAKGVPNTATAIGGARVTGTVESRIVHFVPASILSSFGNLPRATQQFLIEPFMGANRLPQDADLDATIQVTGGRVEESYNCYLFNSRSIAFVSAFRSVPHTSGSIGPHLWNASPEKLALIESPWTIAAWTASVKRPPNAGLSPR